MPYEPVLGALRALTGPLPHFMPIYADLPLFRPERPSKQAHRAREQRKRLKWALEGPLYADLCTLCRFSPRPLPCEPVLRVLFRPRGRKRALTGRKRASNLALLPKGPTGPYQAASRTGLEPRSVNRSRDRLTGLQASLSKRARGPTKSGLVLAGPAGLAGPHYRSGQ